MLNSCRNCDVDAQELAEIGRTLDFVTKRLDACDKPQWQGMFKKNPMW